MRHLLDTVWQRRGTSWIWDEEARNQVCAASEVWSLRLLLRAVGRWPEDLPSNEGRTLVVAGLEGCLDLLAPGDAETWLGDAIKAAILSFQDAYAGEAALIFWRRAPRAGRLGAPGAHAHRAHPARRRGRGGARAQGLAVL